MPVLVSGNSYRRDGGRSAAGRDDHRRGVEHVLDRKINLGIGAERLEGIIDRGVEIEGARNFVVVYRLILQGRGVRTAGASDIIIQDVLLPPPTPRPIRSEFPGIDGITGFETKQPARQPADSVQPGGSIGAGAFGRRIKAVIGKVPQIIRCNRMKCQRSRDRAERLDLIERYGIGDVEIDPRIP